MRLPFLAVGLSIFLGLTFGSSAGAGPEAAQPVQPLPPEAIPKALREWIPWVLATGPAGQDRRACPLGPAGKERLCAWPGVLELDLNDTGGRFKQVWEVFAETWVPLPGDPEQWPQEVRAGDRQVPVAQRDGRPAVKLAPGTQAISGVFSWRRRPDALALPPSIALLSLTNEGQVVPWPRLAEDGRLWLKTADQAQLAQDGDRLSMEVYRHVEDDQPLRVLTRLELSVSGQGREIRLGPVLLARGVPLDLKSPLPAKLETDGMLRLQVRPGRWVVEVASYHAGAVSELKRMPAKAPWPEQEVWAFAARPALRQVEPSGLRAVDPRQTRIPDAWSRLPVFLSLPGQVFELKETRRGDPDPGPDQLRLARELWLDFSGDGYSLRDEITGELTRSERLEVGPQVWLGQAQVGGAAVLISRLSVDSPPGVEVRRGNLALQADGRLESAANPLPISGWSIPFNSVTTALHLPPGWDLLAVSGVDNVPGTWIDRWTLLDLFLVLIVVIGVWRLYGWGWGLIAALGLALTWHAEGAPKLIWLSLLAAAALLKVLPAGSLQPGVAKLRSLVLLYFRLSLIALLAVGLPFLVSEVRQGLYPQLAHGGWTEIGEGGGGSSRGAIGFQFEDVVMEPELDASTLSRGKMASKPLSAPSAPPAEIADRLDPDSRVQTGVGVPDWRWNTFNLMWTGPVNPAEGVSLWLLTPRWNLAVAMIGSLLIVLLGLRLGGLKLPKIGGHSTALLLAVGFASALGSADTEAGELPSPQLLKELREHLLAPPDCLPHCVELSAMDLSVADSVLSLRLTLDASASIAAPVPGGVSGWTPNQVSLNGELLDRLGRAKDRQLLVPLPVGRNQVLLAGPLPPQGQIDLALPLQPRHLRVNAEGWRVEGVDANGRPGGQIRLLRAAAPGTNSAERPLTQEALPPLIEVTRRIQIGTHWRAETRVRRLSSRDFSVLLPVPRLPGESVETPGVQVVGAQVQVGLAPGSTQMVWASSLEPTASLDLSASTDTRITEIWEVDVSPRWHLEYQGIPRVHLRGASKRYLPTWHPRPGESLTLKLTRPDAVPGPTLTLDRVDYQVTPGRRESRAQLTLAARSSQGGFHAVELPDGAEPTSLEIDGRSLPLPAAADASAIEFPLVPGTQEVQLAWRDSRALRWSFSPASPGLNTEAVNLHVSIQMPTDRWILFASGPQVGPAVLFWGVLLVLVVFSIGLGRSRLTPLRSYDWLLLGIGLSLAEVWVSLLIAGWLFALGLRQRLGESTARWRFNLAQIGLVLLTLGALSGLVGAVEQGLLGRPEMQITGNGSSATALNWYLDRGGPELPGVWVLSVPLWVYRALMLAWALWLAFRLLGWLRWGWQGFSQPQLWREGPPRPKKAVKPKPVRE